MRTLLLTLVFAPDGVSTATILTELAARLTSRGHDVSVVTTTPHYNRDPDALAAQPMRSRAGGLLRESESRGTPVLHVPVRPKGTRVLSRALDYLKFHLIGTIAAPFAVQPYDIVLAVSPPLTIGLAGMCLGWFRRVPFVYNVQEIYPDIAVSLGMLRNRALIRALEACERFVYKRAAAVVVISERFRRRLLAKGVPASKLHVIPNFVDVDFITPRPTDNAFAQEHGLAGRFVVLYAGNIGLTQDFERLIEAASLLRDRPDVQVVIVGDGARRDWVAAEVERRALHNISLLPYQPRSRVPDVYATASVGVVPMYANTAEQTFPSKIYTIMAAGRAAVVAAEPESELSSIVREVGCGRAVPPGDANALAAAIGELAAAPDEARMCGARGRAYVAERHSPAAVARQYDDLLRALAGLKA